MFTMFSKHGSPIRVTVVGEHKDGVLTLAVARCSKNDVFTKKDGLEIAIKRLNHGNYFEKVDIKECNGKVFKRWAQACIAELETAENPSVYHSDVVDYKRNRRIQAIENSISKLQQQLARLKGEIKDDGKPSGKVLSLKNDEPEEHLHATQEEA
jgi:uncharacterized protein YlxW (UPF0749 family)